MNKKVFLSYSWKDELIAGRLYEDLVRSNVPIWRDRIDGDPLADFEKEFLNQIDQCDYFIMLDSVNYRMKSHWCREEVERCLQKQDERKNDSPKIIVCLIDKDGDWRKDFSNDRDVFKRINGLNYQNLYYTGYDNDAVYDKALDFICKELGVTYERWDRIPTYQDLMDEINGATNCDSITKEIITSGYANIFNKQKKKYPNIKESYKVWLEDCRQVGIKLFFPEWAYAVWYANQPNRDDYESLRLFEDIISQYPQDARGYRGYGVIAAAIGDKARDIGNESIAIDYYSMAEKALLEAERRMDDRQRKICEFEVLYNLGMIYYKTTRNEKTQLYWGKALDIMISDGFFNKILVDDYFILLKKKGVVSAYIKNWLHNLMNHYPTESILFQLSGLVYQENHEYNEALKLYQKAFILDSSPQNLYFLLNLKLRFGFLSHKDMELIERIINDYHEGETEWIDALRSLHDSLK